MIDEKASRAVTAYFHVCKGLGYYKGAGSVLEIGCCWCAVSILPYATADSIPQHACGTATMTAWCRPAGIASHDTLLFAKVV